ncbi:hypothetical protein F2Q69_00010780 [Brassica cretica]|uniref:Methyltransferase n=1 Tax=Brassica cretica TaxID=69181 RepID=A0A8S9QZX6_BRACR|nr:hypothetical protein F2Q69_00010780 [Brassica cretica]
MDHNNYLQIRLLHHPPWRFCRLDGFDKNITTQTCPASYPEKWNPKGDPETCPDYFRMYHPVPDLELFIQCHDIPQIWRRDYRPRRGVNVLQSSITVAMTVL